MRLEKRNILVLCRTNSTTSVIVEALFHHLGGGEWRAHSAGVEPAVVINVHAFRTLRMSAIPVQSGMRPKSWRSFEGPDAPRFDVVLTVDEEVAWANMPAWNGVPRLMHWALPDPMTCDCSAAERIGLFAAVLDLARDRVTAFLAEEARLAEADGGDNDNRTSAWSGRPLIGTTGR